MSERSERMRDIDNTRKYIICISKQPCSVCLLLESMLTREGLIWEGGLIYLLLKLYDKFLPTQSNACKTSISFLKRLDIKLFKHLKRCSTIRFFSYSIYI